MKNTRWFARTWMGMVYGFLYLPVVILIVFSFNKGRSAKWQGFSTKAYEDLVSNSVILDSLLLSLRIAVTTAIFSVIIGTLIAYVLTRYKRFNGRTLFSGMANTPLVMPEVVLGVALLMVFSRLLQFGGEPLIPMGYWTVVLGHSLLGAAYAAVVIKARFSEIPSSFEEAALDLGAKPLSAFFLVTLPLIAQSLVAAFLLVFTISFDDVVISEFLKGSTKPLPSVIFENARFGAKPVVNALGATIVFVVSAVLISGSVWMQKREKKRQAEIAAAFRDAT